MRVIGCPAASIAVAASRRACWRQAAKVSPVSSTKRRASVRGEVPASRPHPASGVGADVQGAHGDVSGHPDLVGDAAWHPHRALGRHRPAPLAGGDEHGAVGGEDELGPLVAVRRDAVAAGEVLRHGGDGARYPLVVGGVDRSVLSWGAHVRISTMIGPL